MSARRLRAAPQFMVALAVSVLVAASADAQVPASQDSWSFEETSGLSVTDSSGSNPGTLVNGAARTTTSFKARGLSLDGVDDYVVMGDASSLEPTAFTVSLWVRRNGAQVDWARIFNKGAGSAPPWGSYKLEFSGASDDTLVFQVGFTDASYVQTQNAHPLADGVWTHVVA